MDNIADKIFKVFLDDIYCPFYVYKKLQNQKYNKVYCIYKYFWGTIVNALQITIFVRLASLFDNDSDSLSFNYCLSKKRLDSKQTKRVKQILKKNQKITYKVTKWRNWLYAHNDIQALDASIITTKFPLNYNELEDLIKDIKKLVEIIIHEKVKFPEIPDFVSAQLAKTVGRDFIVMDNYDKGIMEEIDMLMQKLAN